MNIKVTIPPERQHPYLAVHNSAEINFAGGIKYLPEDIVVVSKMKTGETLVTYIIGTKGSFETQYEIEYMPLEAGTKIEITQ